MMLRMPRCALAYFYNVFKTYREVAELLITLICVYAVQDSSAFGREARWSDQTNRTEPIDLNRHSLNAGRYEAKDSSVKDNVVAQFQTIAAAT
jgi:hypothetical protein